VNCLNPPHHIFKAADYVDLNALIGERVDELSGLPVRVSYMSFLRDPRLHRRYAAVVLGNNETSGWGKSSLAESSARAWCLDRCERNGLPLESAMYLRVNSIDSIRAHQKSIDGIGTFIFDEVVLADRSQVQHMSENGVKSLLDVTRPADLRAREHQVILPADVPRIFTANSGSLEEWLGDVVVHIRDCIPIFRRAFVFVMTQRQLRESAVLAIRPVAGQSGGAMDSNVLGFF
jgi:hypothetical protein